GALAAAARLRAAAASPWWAVVVGLAPGMYLALRRDLADALAYALVALGIYLFYRGEGARLPWSAIVFALAVLARETTAVFPVILALIPLPRSRLRAGWGLSLLQIPLLPFLPYCVAPPTSLPGR